MPVATRTGIAVRRFLIAGDWETLTLGSSNANLSYCKVRYGGSLGYSQVQVQAGSPTISNSRIENGKYDGVYSASYSTASPTLSNNIIDNNGGDGVNLGATGAVMVTGNQVYQNTGSG